MNRKEFEAKDLNALVEFLRAKVVQAGEITDTYDPLNYRVCLMAQFYGPTADISGVILDGGDEAPFPRALYAIAMGAGSFTRALELAEMVQRGELVVEDMRFFTPEGFQYRA